MSGSLADSVRIVTQRVRIVTNRCQDCYPKCQDCYPGCQDRYRECQDCQRRVRIVGVSLSKAEEDVSSVGNQRQSDSRPGTSSAGFVSKCQDCQRLVSGSLGKASGSLVECQDHWSPVAVSVEFDKARFSTVRIVGESVRIIGKSVRIIGKSVRIIGQNVRIIGGQVGSRN